MVGTQKHFSVPTRRHCLLPFTSVLQSRWGPSAAPGSFLPRGRLPLRVEEPRVPGPWDLLLFRDTWPLAIPTQNLTGEVAPLPAKQRLPFCQLGEVESQCWETVLFHLINTHCLWFAPFFENSLFSLFLLIRSASPATKCSVNLFFDSMNSLLGQILCEKLGIQWWPKEVMWRAPYSLMRRTDIKRNIPNKYLPGCLPPGGSKGESRSISFLVVVPIPWFVAPSQSWHHSHLCFPCHTPFSDSPAFYVPW